MIEVSFVRLAVKKKVYQKLIFYSTVNYIISMYKSDFSFKFYSYFETRMYCYDP